MYILLFDLNDISVIFGLYLLVFYGQLIYNIYGAKCYGKMHY